MKVLCVGSRRVIFLLALAVAEFTATGYSANPKDRLVQSGLCNQPTSHPARASNVQSR